MSFIEVLIDPVPQRNTDLQALKLISDYLDMRDLALGSMFRACMFSIIEPFYFILLILI